MKTLRNVFVKPGTFEWKPSITCRFREISEERRREFLDEGYNKKRQFFPHRIYYVPKPGPDAVELGHRMCGESDPNRAWEVILYASPPLVDELPEDL